MASNPRLDLTVLHIMADAAGDPDTEVQVVNAEPLLNVNGVDVVGPSGIEIPQAPGCLALGFGADINPVRLTGSEESLGVDFEADTLFELAN